jgi:hypothetical protein
VTTRAYSSRANLDAIIGRGGMPFIAFKERPIIHTEQPWSVWTQMWHYYNYRRDTFLQHYHKRSNVETTFSMIKSKFGSHIRSKTPTAQINELLCKVLCHNICVLIASIFELNLEPTFWAESTSAQKVVS